MVAALKAQYGLQYIFAWHAMFGFWGGLGLVDPEMQKYEVSVAGEEERGAGKWLRDAGVWSCGRRGDWKVAEVVVERTRGYRNARCALRG